MDFSSFWKQRCLLFFLYEISELPWLSINKQLCGKQEKQHLIMNISMTFCTCFSMNLDSAADFGIGGNRRFEHKVFADRRNWKSTEHQTIYSTFTHNQESISVNLVSFKGYFRRKLCSMFTFCSVFSPMLVYLMVAFFFENGGKREKFCLNLGNPDCSIQTNFSRVDCFIQTKFSRVECGRRV